MTVDQIQEDLKQAQLSRDEVRVSTLRLLLSEIRNAQIAKGDTLEGQELIGVIQKELKKRREAAAGFRQGGREEQAQKEEAEAGVLQAYLPEQLSDEELTKLVEESINEVGATKLSDMGKVMSLVMNRVAGKAEGVRVSSMVQKKLQNNIVT